jgi:hypothetical protein
VLAELDKAIAEGDGCGSSARRRIELGPDLGHIVGDGATAYAERGGNLFVRLPADEQLQDLTLPCGQVAPRTCGNRRRQSGV